jgi:hypothetical protein
MVSRGTALLPLACTVVCGVYSPADEQASRRSLQPRDFDLPAGDAVETLPRFATASGEQIVFLVDNVRGERTQAVTGKFSAQEALRRMLRGTALVMSQDPATGAFFVGRKRPATAAFNEYPSSHK